MNGIIKKIILSTDSFTIEENNQLISMLYDKFYLRFAIDEQNHLVLYDQFQIIYFLPLVSPWLHASMQRKALIEVQPRPIGKKTTICLLKAIQIIKLITEINENLASCRIRLVITFK